LTPVDPTFLTSGVEWTVPPVAGDGTGPDAAAATGGAGGGFGDLLAKQLGNLQSLQDDATTKAHALATGQATDPTEVVMAVERARLAMQLASTIRTKGVEAINDVMHTTV